MEWIAIAEGTPKEDEQVLIYDESEGIYVGSRIEGGKWRIYASEAVTSNVTHWMPLPEKPADPVIQQVTSQINSAVAGKRIIVPGTSIIDTDRVSKIAADRARELGINHVVSPGTQTTEIEFYE